MYTPLIPEVAERPVGAAGADGVVLVTVVAAVGQENPLALIARSFTRYVVPWRRLVIVKGLVVELTLIQLVPSSLE
jgi:hypothetical protein